MAKAELMPPVDKATLPLSLAERFGAAAPEGVVRLLVFLAPITTR